jgi:hypothetical protein
MNMSTTAPQTASTITNHPIKSPEEKGTNR